MVKKNRSINRTSTQKHKNKKAETPCKNRFLNALSELLIEELSKEIKYCQKKSKKISPESLIKACILAFSKGRSTLTDIAAEMEKITGKSVSKQAVYKRINSRLVELLQTLIKEKIKKHVNKDKVQNIELFKHFSNVHIQDSTCINLSDDLAEYFLGGSNGKGKRSAIAKINVVYNALRETFSLFELRSFANNDQSLSGSILHPLQKGDLVIRDSGFFSLAVLMKIIKREACFLMKKPHNVKLYDVSTKKEINLPNLLKKKGYVDMEVFVGSEKQVRARLVAVPVPDKVAEQRIRKARNDRDKRKNHSKDYYSLLKYSIFLTNVPKEMWQPEDVVQAYGYRWRIEIIFKAWKSYFNIERIFHPRCNNKTRVECMIYIMLLYILIFHVDGYAHYSCIFIEKHKKYISLLKMARLVTCHIEGIILGRMTEEAFIREIARHALYDARKDRKNTMETYYSMGP